MATLKSLGGLVDNADRAQGQTASGWGGVQRLREPQRVHLLADGAGRLTGEADLILREV